MKKGIIIITTLLFCLMTSTCLANYFDDNSDRFISYQSTKHYKEYVDLDSINVIRYDPPYYVIQAETYVFDYVKHLDMRYVNQYFYNYDNKNINWQVNAMAKCDENRNISNEVTLEDGKQPYLALGKTSPGYRAAKIVFEKAYDIPFTKKNNNH